MKKVAIVLFSTAALFSVISTSMYTKADSLKERGNTSVKALFITKPEVNDIHSTDRVVTGRGRSNATIRVYNSSGVVIGLGTAENTGEFSIHIEDQYLPLQKNEEIRVTQDIGYGQSDPNIVYVLDGDDRDAKAKFKTGYWSDDQSFLDIEGLFENSSFDFTNKSSTNFILQLKNSRGEIKYSVAGVTTDFYTAERYDGYQALIETSAIGNSTLLPSGSYTISIKAVNINGTSDSALVVPNFSLKYLIHHDWNDIESKNINGRTVTFTVGSDGLALINIK